MSLVGGAGKLSGARKDLLLQWDRVRRTWRDANAEHFEKAYLHEWEQQVNAAHRAMTSLAATLKQLRRDCE